MNIERNGRARRVDHNKRSTTIGLGLTFLAGMLDMRKAHSEEKITRNAEGEIVNFYGISREDVINNLSPDHQMVMDDRGEHADPYAGLVDEHGGSCCNGQDCRVARVVRLNPNEPNPRYAVAINLSGQPRFGIADASMGTTINPHRMAPAPRDDGSIPIIPLPNPGENHACMRGGGRIQGGMEQLANVRCLILSTGT